MVIRVQTSCEAIEAENSGSWPQRYDDLKLKCRDPRLQKFYAGGTVTPQTPIVNTPMIAMDFETTGLDANAHEIVSVGIVPFSMHRIYCRDSAHWLIKPKQALTEGSVVIHGITHSDINEAPDLEAILEELLAAINGRIVVVHYRHIEREFLGRALLERLGETIEFPVIDTMELERRVLCKRRKFIHRLLQRPLGSLRLGDCRERYGLPHYQAHHALTDALATAELLQAQLNYHYSAETPISNLWS